MDDFEIRAADIWPDVDFEMRATTEGDGLTVTGYAGVFDRLSLPMRFAHLNRGRPFREIMHPGSVTQTLASSPDIRLRLEHDETGLPLARTKSGTMTLAADAVGVRFMARLAPEDSRTPSVRSSIQRRDVDGVSLRFLVIKDNAVAGQFPVEETSPGVREHVRHLHEIRLMRELSLTDAPAYPDTVVGVRALADSAGMDPDDLAEAFRDLRETETPLDPKSYTLILQALDTRLGVKHEHPSIAQRRARLAEVFAH